MNKNWWNGGKVIRENNSINIKIQDSNKKVYWKWKSYKNRCLGENTVHAWPSCSNFIGNKLKFDDT